MVDSSIIIVYLIAFCLWLPQAIHQVLTWTYWWQVKEYRLDRFWVFLTTSDGREKLGVPKILLKFAGLLLVNLFPLISFSIFLYYDYIFVSDILRRRVRVPVITQRIERIWLTCFFAIFLTFISVYFWFLNSFITGEILLILAPYIGILWTIPIVNKIKRLEIIKAKNILGEVKPKVIGIAGSYGKTTTKEFVAHILSQKYKTARTEGSENTEFGIARKTSKNVKKDTKFYVVEMGAYKLGEIKKLTDIVSPSVGIITGIELQHISLFGSLENIQKAKFELIESLPEGGLAVFNLSNSFVRNLYKKAKKMSKKLKIYGYITNEENDRKIKADMISKIYAVDEKSITFEVTDGRERRRFSANIPGVNLIENVTCAILIARIFGLSWNDIDKGVRTLKLPASTMKVIKMDNAVIIDDSYNSTPKGFEAAIRYLTFFENRKKVVFTPGIIELGTYSDSIHQKLGGLMKDKVEKVILLTREPLESMKQGLAEKKSKLVFMKDKDRLKNEFDLFVKNGYLILFEGRMPKSLHDLIENFENV